MTRTSFRRPLKRRTTSLLVLAALTNVHAAPFFETFSASVSRSLGLNVPVFLPNASSPKCQATYQAMIAGGKQRAALRQLQQTPVLCADVPASFGKVLISRLQGAVQRNAPNGAKVRFTTNSKAASALVGTPGRPGALAVQYASKHDVLLFLLIPSR